MYIPCIYCLKYFEPSPVPTLYVGRVEDLLGRVPLIPCFLDGNATSTIPHKYSSRQRDAFECGCADGAGPNSRRGSHVYEINTWLWNFGRPQPRVGGLSVAKTEKIRRKSRSEASKRGWATRLAPDFRMVYAQYIPGISRYIHGISCLEVKHDFWVQMQLCPEMPCCIYAFALPPTSIAPLKAGET